MVEYKTNKTAPWMWVVVGLLFVVCAAASIYVDINTIQEAAQHHNETDKALQHQSEEIAQLRADLEEVKAAAFKKTRTVTTNIVLKVQQAP